MTSLSKEKSGLSSDNPQQNNIQFILHFFYSPKQTIIYLGHARIFAYSFTISHDKATRSDKSRIQP